MFIDWDATLRSFRTLHLHPVCWKPWWTSSETTGRHIMAFMWNSILGRIYRKYIRSRLHVYDWNMSTSFFNHVHGFVLKSARKDYWLNTYRVSWTFSDVFPYCANHALSEGVLNCLCACVRVWVVYVYFVFVSVCLFWPVGIWDYVSICAWTIYLSIEVVSETSTMSSSMHLVWDSAPRKLKHLTTKCGRGAHCPPR